MQDHSFLHTHVFVPAGAYIGSIMTGTAAIWGWIGTNQPQLTVMLGLCGFIVACISAYRQDKWVRQEKKRKGVK